jgi:hypothetical protein
MDNAVKGSMLFEYLIYSGVVYVLLFLVVRCSSMFYTTTKQRSSSDYDALQALSIITMLRKDLWQAPAHSSLWLSRKQDEIIWRAGSIDIGWVLLKDELYRIQGNYDKSQAHWNAAHKALIARNVSLFSVSLLEHTEQKEVIAQASCALALSRHKKELKWNVHLRASLCVA